MSDISVGKSSNNKNLVKVSKRKQKYSYLKKEYNSFMKKSAKSDLANSPMIKEKELEILVQMKTAAEKEGLTDEIAFIETRMAEIAITVDTTAELPAGYYIPITPVSSGKNNDEPAIQPDNGIEAAALYNEEESVLDTAEKISQDDNQNFSGIISAFKQNGINDYELSYLLKKIKDYDSGNLPDIIRFLELFANLGVYPNNAIQAIDNSLYIDDTDKGNLKEKIDIRACQRFADFKADGTDDIQALKFAKFLDDKFKDEASIKTYMVNMLNSGISEDAVINIIDALSVKESQNEKKKISPDAIKSVIQLKKILMNTRTNEKKERDNPINQLGVYRFEADDKTIIMKDNEVIYITPVQGESVYNLTQEYNRITSEIEDDLLVKFASEYKKESGETNPDCLRIIAALRRAGVTYDQLFKMTDFCMSNGNIASDKLNTICKLKKAGCLGADILALMNVFNKTEDGRYDEEDIKNACDLSSAVIGGKETALLLPEVYGNSDVKDLLMFFSQLFDNKSDLENLFPLIEKEDGTFDENAMSILYNLAENLYNSEDNHNINDKEFLKKAKDMIFAAMNKDDSIVNDEGAGICSVMCKNGYTPEEIIQGLNVCKERHGNIDKRLSELLWQMALEKADIAQITKLIESVCIDENNNVNHYMARKMTQYLQQGCGIDKIMNFIAEEE